MTDTSEGARNRGRKTTTQTKTLLKLPQPPSHPQTISENGQYDAARPSYPRSSSGSRGPSLPVSSPQTDLHLHFQQDRQNSQRH
jgi:hypothetical protein